MAGEPLLPLLFIIVMDIHMAIFHKAESTNSLASYQDLEFITGYLFTRMPRCSSLDRSSMRWWLSGSS